MLSFKLLPGLETLCEAQFSKFLMRPHAPLAYESGAASLVLHQQLRMASASGQHFL
jgi:hypothetical protein